MNGVNGVQRIRARFKRVNARGDAALMPFFVAGYPTMRQCRENLWQAYEADANLIELGIPFSDPVADGPTIARATHHALKHGVTPRKCLDLVRGLRKEGFSIPIVGMTYANLVYAPGFDSSARAWAQAGLDGAIVPDISVEDSAPFRAAFSKQGLATTFFASPSTEPDRLKKALRASTGFLYLVSVYGTTGARRSIGPETLALLERVRRARGPKGPPICVGFGVSHPEHARILRQAKAEGIILGSALVDAIDRGTHVGRLLKKFKLAAAKSREPR